MKTSVLSALRQDDGLKERLRGLIRQTYAEGLAEDDPLCLALAEQPTDVLPLCADLRPRRHP